MKKLIYLSLMSIVFMSSCKKEEIIKKADEPTTTVTGFVRVYNEVGTATPARDGVTITIDGTDKSGISNLNGKFNILGVKEGNYRFTASKDGYDDYKGTFTVPIASGNAPYNLGNYPLYEFSKTTVTTLTSSISYPPTYVGYYLDTNVVITSGYTGPNSIAGSNVSRGVRIFIDTTSLVSKTKYFYNDDRTFIDWSTSAVFTISTKTLRTNFNIKKGAKLYIAVYGISGYSNSYYDLDSGLYIYLGQNPEKSTSNVIIP